MDKLSSQSRNTRTSVSAVHDEKESSAYYRRLSALAPSATKVCEIYAKTAKEEEGFGTKCAVRSDVEWRDRFVFSLVCVHRDHP